jgi:hypothetical protein
MAAIAVLHAILAYGMWTTNDVGFAYVSTTIFLIAAVACGVLAVRPTSSAAVAWAGASSMVAYAHRAGLVLWYWSRGEAELTNGRIIIIVTGLILLTIYAYLVFLRGIAPLSGVYRREDRELAGDG